MIQGLPENVNRIKIFYDVFHISEINQPLRYTSTKKLKKSKNMDNLLACDINEHDLFEHFDPSLSLILYIQVWAKFYNKTNKNEN